MNMLLCVKFGKVNVLPLTKRQNHEHKQTVTHTVCMLYLIYGQLLSSSSWVSKSVGGASKLIVQVIFTPHLIRKTRLILRSISYHQRWKTKHKSVSIVQHLGSSDLTYSWDNITMTFKRYKKA